jgi:hypothetical protein
MALVLIVPNEALPRVGAPASGPGLRALNLAVGLQANGHDVIVSVPAVPHRATNATLCKRGRLIADIEEVPIDLTNLPAFIRLRQPDVAIFTNYVNFHNFTVDGTVPNLGRTKLIYDFFGPRILEQSAAGLLGAEKLEAERQRKINALHHADAILLNGTKKRGYVSAWLALAQADLSIPVIDTPFCIPVDPAMLAPRPALPAGAPLRLLISGDQQPWTKSTVSLVDIMAKTLQYGWSFTRIGRPGLNQLEAAAKSYMPWLRTDAVSAHSEVDFSEFLQHLGEADLALDLFEMTRERELAFVTRTAVALSAGLPVIHPADTETGDLISRWKCGWTYKNEAEIFGILDWIHANADSLNQRAAAARAFAKSTFNPKQATAGAAQLIREMSVAEPKIMERVSRVEATDSRKWYARLTSREWLIRRFNIEYFTAAKSTSAADLYDDHAEMLGNPPPNFVLQYALERGDFESITDLTVEAGARILEKYFDVPWYAKTYDVAEDILACAEDYFLQAGIREISPNPYFCETLYLATNLLARESVKNRLFINGFHHFLAVGMAERLTASVLFDEEYYLTCNPDVARAVSAGMYKSGYEHFFLYGYREERGTTPLFDPNFYRCTNIELPETWPTSRLILHFLTGGLTEGRFGSSFHETLVTEKLECPPFDDYAKHASQALEELEKDGHDSEDLRNRIHRHFLKVQRSFMRDLDRNTDWLQRLKLYQF